MPRGFGDRRHFFADHHLDWHAIGVGNPKALAIGPRMGCGQRVARSQDLRPQGRFVFGIDADGVILGFFGARALVHDTPAV